MRCNSSGLASSFVPELFRTKIRRSRVRTIRNKFKSNTFSEDSADIRNSLEKLGLILGEKIGEGSSALIYCAFSTGLSGFGKTSWQGEKGKVHAVKVAKLSEGKEENVLLRLLAATLLKMNHILILKVFQSLINFIYLLKKNI